MSTFFSDAIFADGVPYLEKAFRTAVVYLAVLIGMRLAGKRELGQMSTVDLVAILLLASAVETAIQAGDESIAGGVVAFALLVVFGRITAILTFHFPRLRRLAEGNPIQIVRDGQLDTSAIRREQIPREEVMMKIEQQGLDGIGEVERVVLETDGSVTVKPRWTNSVSDSIASKTCCSTALAASRRPETRNRRHAFPSSPLARVSPRVTHARSLEKAAPAALRNVGRVSTERTPLEQRGTQVA